MKYDRRKKTIEREPTLGINKYQFCEACKHIIDTPEGNTCPARFNPYDDVCPDNERFIERERRKNSYATRVK